MRLKPTAVLAATTSASSSAQIAAGGDEGDAEKVA